MQFQVFFHGEFPVQGGFLKDDADILTYFVLLQGYIMTIDPKFTVCFFLYGAQSIDGGAFPGPVRSQESKDGSLFDVERDVIYCGKITKILGEVLYFNAVCFQYLIPFILLIIKEYNFVVYCSIMLIASNLHAFMHFRHPEHSFASYARTCL